MKLEEILKNQPQYRLKQIEKAWFDVGVNSYEEISTLPKELRGLLKNEPWLTVKLKLISKSKIDGTQKALLELADGNLIETVLMGRENSKKTREADERYTICISSQVGCAMNCSFCATGKSGYKRNLTAQEIADQYRFWQRSLAERLTHPLPLSTCGEGWPKTVVSVSNIVLMGQGEPLLNYENVKKALNLIIDNTQIGPTKITVSTCGIPEMMDRILADKDFPQVRWAVSLHSAIEETRKKIMPSHKKDFLKFLVDWSNRYHQLIPSRTHFIGLEYLLLAGVNDDQKHLDALKKLARKMPRVRINLIPYNETRTTYHVSRNKNQDELKKSSQSTIDHWHDYLMKADLTCTIRYSQGQDIAAACGQLANKVTS